MLLGERWTIEGLRVDGREIAAPQNGAAWLEFGPDGIIWASDGCHPSARPAVVSQDHLTVEPAKHPFAPSRRSTSPGRGCDAEEEEFRGRLQESFTGKLALRYDNEVMGLKNEQGNQIFIRMSRVRSMFGRRYLLDHIANYNGEWYSDWPASEAPWLRFRPDGTIEGGTGCRKLSGRAVFEGSRVAIGPLAVTAGDSCTTSIPAQIQSFLDKFPNTFTWTCLRNNGRLDLSPDADMRYGEDYELGFRTVKG
ncbi:META domain-containing protein [Streptomyces sp. NPDC058877]|uniref:META domain-containing protein n=1 Tax=unclassified Streptomyces TaxID=2593676 RepID=UPI0036C394D9